MLKTSIPDSSSLSSGELDNLLLQLTTQCLRHALRPRARQSLSLIGFLVQSGPEDSTRSRGDPRRVASSGPDIPSLPLHSPSAASHRRCRAQRPGVISVVCCDAGTQRTTQAASRRSQWFLSVSPCRLFPPPPVCLADSMSALFWLRPCPSFSKQPTTWKLRRKRNF